MKQFIICLVFICAITNLSYSQTKIQQAEDSLNKDSGITSSDNDDDEDSEDVGLFEGIFEEIIAEAFLYITYYTLIESPSEVENINSQASITKYPYFNSSKGNYTYDLDENYSIFRTELASRYVSESNALKGMNLSLDMRFLKRIGIELGYRQLWEKNSNLGNNNLALYNVLVKYHRVRTEKLDLWWGVGTTYVDGDVNKYGFTYGVGSELFFAKPLSVEINFDQTFINTETVNKFNALLNYHIKRYKVMGGYDHLKIGTQRFSSVTLGVGVIF